MRLQFFIILLMMLSCCHAALNIACDYFSTSRPIVKFVYYCHVQTAVITTEPNQAVNSFTGTHATYYSNSNVVFLYFYGKTVNYVPKGIQGWFTLIGLEISRSKLRMIGKADISPMTSLQILILDNNELETLEANLFEANTALQYINFQYNKLKHIGLDILAPLTSLTLAYFSGNICINKDASTSATVNDLKKVLDETCPTFDGLQKKCQKRYDNYTATISSLEADNQKMQKELKDVKFQFKADNEKFKFQLKAVNENLDSATKNLYMIKNSLPYAAKSDKTKLVCENSTESDTCNAYVFNIKIAGSKIEVVDQSHEKKSSDKIKTLTVSWQQTFYLPNNLVEHFPELNNFSVVDSGLFEIEPDVFEDLVHLEFLNLSHNKLREIKTDTFKEQKDLKRLDLSFNRIEILNKDAFLGLDNVQTLKLNDNRMVRIDGRSIEHMSKLKILSLENNLLNYISPTLLTPLNSLEKADLSNNKCVDMSFPDNALKAIETKLTDNCVAPIDLICSFKLLKSVVDGTTSYMCSAQSLKIVNPKTRISNVMGKNLQSYGTSDIKVFLISGQTSEFLPFEMSKVMPKIEQLFVHNSKLSRLQAKDFEGLKNLKNIAIRGNKIKKISSETFNDVSQLETLDLSGNEIKELPGSVFGKLTKLIVLNLSGNELEKINADILVGKKGIEQFIFSNNQLDYIELKLLKFLPKATVIDFTGNMCIDERVDVGAKGSKKIAELFGDVGLKCTLDD